MAAITTHLERGGNAPDPDPIDLSLGAIEEGNTKGDPRELETARKDHLNLTRMLWGREAILAELVGKSVQVAPENPTTGEGPLFLYLLDAKGRSTELPKDTIPWTFASQAYPRFEMWGSVGKMACPTFDIPAGADRVGGSCPGARFGQSIIEKFNRPGKLPHPAPGEDRARPVEIGRSTCEKCYAFDFSYQGLGSQGKEVILMWWLKAMLKAGKHDQLVNTLLHSVLATDKHNFQRGIYPVRLHSAGDFFSVEYAEVWLEVANRLWDLGKRHPGHPAGLIRMWAPTRTWAAWGSSFWAKELPKLHSLRDREMNLIIRPSAYHVGDAAPGQAGQEGAPRRPAPAVFPLDWHEDETFDFLLNARGSSTIRAMDTASTPPKKRNTAAQALLANRGMHPEVVARAKPALLMNAAAGAPDTRYHWDCQAFAVLDTKKTCDKAVGPDGEVGCRACWTFPHASINYREH